MTARSADDDTAASDNSNVAQVASSRQSRATGWLIRAAMTGLLALLVGAAAWTTRSVHHAKVHVPEQAQWVSSDPDGWYHARRTLRVFSEGLPVAEHDPYLDFPRGSAIPWPPYYTLALAGALRPFLPDVEDQQRPIVERGVATLPAVFATATAIIVGCSAWSLAGYAAGIFAGLYFALAYASIAYSRIGNGDHHAWVTLLLAALIALFAAALKNGAMFERARALRYGSACGLLAGVALGSWVAALVGIIVIEATLGWLLFRHVHWRRSALATFGIAFHATAALVVAPAIASSPWKEEFPWLVVNLSYYHALHLVVGGLVFVGLLRVPHTRRAYPWYVLASLLAVAALLFVLDLGPARGIREGIAWSSRTDEFMAGISESRPLVGAGALPLAETIRLLGHGMWFLPLAVLVCARRAVMRADSSLPWLVAAAAFGLQALSQARFAEALLGPLAVLLAALIAWALRGLPGKLAGIGLVAAVGLPLLAHWETAHSTWQLMTSDARIARGPEHKRKRAVRRMHEWLRANTPASDDYCVMANWSQGHALEWVADRPSVATNFGSYIGADSYADPARFFLARDARTAEALLVRRQARYVFLTTQLPNALPGMLNILDPAERTRLMRGDAQRGVLQPEWYSTIGAALLLGGRPRTAATAAPGESLDFLRMVHASPMRESRPKLEQHADGPMGWIYEHVKGATVTRAGQPGDTLVVTIDMSFDAANFNLRFERSASVEDDGIARLRVPYATQGGAAGAASISTATWRLGRESGTISIDEADVRLGNLVELR